jgi:hypothetical protein
MPAFVFFWVSGLIIYQICFREMSLKSNSPSSLSDDGLVGYQSYLKNPNRKKNYKREPIGPNPYTHNYNIEKKNESYEEEKHTNKIKETRNENVRNNINKLNSTAKDDDDPYDFQIIKKPSPKNPSPKKSIIPTIFFGPKKEKKSESKKRTSKVHPAPKGWKTPPDSVSNWNQPPKYTKNKSRGGKRTQKKSRKSKK